MAAKGDSEPKVYVVAIVGGVFGGVLGDTQGAVIGAFSLAFMYQISEGIPKTSGWGFTVLTAMIPTLVGMVAGTITHDLLNLDNLRP